MITKEEFDELVKKDKYWEGRWSYISEVVKILEKETFDTVLELGAKESCIVKGSEKMDIQDYKVKYLHDATIVPWPIKDKQYDVFIALQVWEHLNGKQKEAFKEVMRTSKMAILSLPYNWDCPNDPMHHGINEEKIKEWTLGIKPVKIVPIINRRPNPKDERNRIIYFYKF